MEVFQKMRLAADARKQTIGREPAESNSENGFATEVERAATIS